MMQMQESKRSEVSATASHSKLFLKARLQLTALYVLIIAVIVVGFSLFLYQSTSANIAELFEANEEDQTLAQQHAFEIALDRLENTMIGSDIVIILLSAGVGYVLAKRTLRPVEKSHEAQRLFAANASHELRTPLAIMKNDIEVLLRDAHPERIQVQRTLSSNLEEIGNMTALIEDLLLLARSGQAQENGENPNVASVIQQTLEKMRPIAKEKGIALEAGAIVAGSVLIPEKILSRALMNIIENSLKYTPSGGKVSVRTTKDAAHAFIEIVDTGTGIPTEELPHIFDRFYRGKSNSSDSGTGLGLAIVKESIEQCNGTVRAESVLDKGTAIVITIPLA